ncbi:MAG: lysophospholipid acyltransferase family protein [Myxococcota bacterium]|nr:lysophospholipid acyltransferase family protein [Myxococcota bacterium]
MPAVLTAAVVWWGLLPVWLPVFAAIDALHPRTTLARAGLAVAVLLAADAVGIGAAVVSWLASGTWAGASPERLGRWSRRIQAIWASTLLGSLVHLFRLDLRTQGDEVLRPGGFLLLMRHVSMTDTLLPMGLVALPHGYAARYVLKAELRWEPCLDIYGARLPNAFVHRGRGQREAEAARVGALGQDLGPTDMVVLFPEGTRFTPARLNRARARTSGHPLLRALSNDLHHTLPPHLPGVLALRRAAPDADIVVCAHAGLGGVRRVADLWNGTLLDRRIDVCFWRIAREPGPVSADATAELLAAAWRTVDAWVGTRSATTP